MTNPNPNPTSRRFKVDGTPGKYSQRRHGNKTIRMTADRAAKLVAQFRELPPDAPAKRFRYDPSLCHIVASMTILGGRLCDVAEALGVAPPLLDTWIATHPELANAIAAARDKAVAAVERSLFQRATGYSREEDVIVGMRNPKTVKVQRYYPPSDAAQRFYLTNRAPNDWRDRSEQYIEQNTNLRGIVAVPATATVSDWEKAYGAFRSQMQELQAALPGVVTGATTSSSAATQTSNTNDTAPDPDAVVAIVRRG